MNSLSTLSSTQHQATHPEVLLSWCTHDHSSRFEAPSHLPGKWFCSSACDFPRAMSGWAMKATPIFCPSRPRQHLQRTIEHPPTPAKEDQRRERSERIARGRNTSRREGTSRRRASRGTGRRNGHRGRVLRGRRLSDRRRALRGRRWNRQR